MARSNRQLTQFAVGKLEEFLALGPSKFVSATAGNTSVALSQSNGLNILSVKLFDETILEAYFGGLQLLEVTLYDGGFYDKQGRPSRTTRERLNGLLDALGAEELIPEGVRAYLSTEADGACHVGCAGIGRPLGRGHEPVTIGANPVNLEFLS